MAKLVTKKFKDKYTGKRYRVGAFFDGTDERAAEINAAPTGPHLMDVLELDDSSTDDGRAENAAPTGDVEPTKKPKKRKEE